MEDIGASYASLVVVIVVALLTPLLLHRLKLNFIPVVVAEIFMGLIIGESGLDLVHDNRWLETFSSLGLIFLIFLSGLEIDFSPLGKRNNRRNKLYNQERGPNSFFVSMAVFIGIFIVSYGISYLFVQAGFMENIFFMSLIFSTISLGVVVPTLKELYLMKTGIGQVILLIAVISNLVIMILLAVFVSLHAGEGEKIWLLLVLFGVSFFLYLVGSMFKGKSDIKAMSSGTIQIGVRAVFALIILLVYISETIGAESILGAFLGGVVVALLAPEQKLVHNLDSFGYGFLIPVFFVMVGVELNIWQFLNEIKMLAFIPLLLITLLLSKLIPIMILRVWYDVRMVIVSGFLLSSTLSLVIVITSIGERI